MPEPEPEPDPDVTGTREPETAPSEGADESHFELSEAPQPASKRYQPAEGDEAKAAAEALQKILALASLDLESEILQGDEQLEIELWGPGQKILLRDRGRLLLAIQHLLPRVVRGLIGHSVSCRVDSDNFHEIREERLRDLAQRAADDVRHRGRTKTLEPMSPDERRIVHLTLSDYPGVETESQGSGLFKRVMVRKIRQGGRGKPRGFDPYNR
jgi:spoIIIJ-associated protein